MMMRAPVIAGSLVFLVLAIAFAGCMQPGGDTIPVPSPSRAIVPVPAATTAPPAAVTQQFTITQAASLPVTTPVATTMPAAGAQVTQENPDMVAYARFQDENFRLEYPGSWNYSETTRGLRESVGNGTECLASVSSFLDERLQTFQARDRTMVFSAWTVDWGNVPVQAIDPKKYRAYINMILNNESLCGVPVTGNVVIAGSTPVSFGTGALSSQKVDFSILNGTGFSEGTGTSYFIRGLHHNGIFIAYVNGTGFDRWRPVTDHIFNSLLFASGF